MELIKELVNKLNTWTKAYDEGNPIVSDKEWDDTYFELARLERESGIYFPDSPTQKVIYQVVNGLNKVKHNHFMSSLDKTKNWEEFVNYFSDKKAVGMLKLDGLTCSLRYIDGKLVSAETRGNGEEGEDILHNALVIPSIPKRVNYKGELVIDGEVICKYGDFEEFKSEYKNPRNFAAGSIRLLDSGVCKDRHLTFVAWHVVKGLSNSVLDNFAELSALGFTVTPYTSTFDSDTKAQLVKEAEDFGYPIDGLVGRFDDIAFGESLGSTSHHTKAAYAFKFYDEEYETNLLSIEYEPSRNGQLTPVAIFEPVDTGDSVVEKASLHNISIMTDLLGEYPEQNQTIWVCKMNDIIPQIVKADKNETMHDHILENAITNHCPICGGETEIRISDSGVKTLWCTNSMCSGKLINVLEHFFGKGKIEIKGLSKATFEKLISLGWISSPRDVYEILPNKRKEWEGLSGFGARSVGKIIDAIEVSRKCTLEQIIFAAGIPLIGGSASKALSKIFKTWESFMDAVERGYEFYNLENFGIEMHNAIINFDYSEIDYIAKNYLIIKATEEQNASNNNLSDIVFCITGKLTKFKNRDELKSKIENAGGKVVGSMSSKVNFLINNDVLSNSAKNKYAITNNIPIITEDEFIETYLKD